jgi:hypothetical protein
MDATSRLSRVPIFISTLTMTRAAAESDLIAVISERNRTMVGRIQMDYNDSITGTSTISNGDLTLTFTLAGTFNGAGPDAGAVIRYSIEDATDDPDNGKDDNGNGVSDEKILVRSNQTTGEQVTVGAFIRDDASGFVANGDGITFTITTMGSNKGSPPRVVYVSKTADVYPFN